MVGWYGTMAVRPDGIHKRDRDDSGQLGGR